MHCFTVGQVVGYLTNDVTRGTLMHCFSVGQVVGYRTNDVILAVPVLFRFKLQFKLLMFCNLLISALDT